MKELFEFFLNSLFKRKQDVIYRTETITKSVVWDLPQGVNDISEVTFYNAGTSQLVVEGLNAGNRGGSVAYNVSAFERLNQQFKIQFFQTAPGQTDLCIVSYKQFQQSSSLWG